jgi:adenine deaminase
LDTELLDLKTRIQAARREISAELVLKGGRVVNVFTGECQEGDVAIHNGLIVGVGPEYSGKEEVDLRDKWIVPGLIDGHFHIESSMLAPAQLAASLLVHGTTTIVSDPHEIANVMGREGIHLLLRESHSLPFDIFFMAPSCVPATQLETAGATLNAADLSILKEEPRVLGLAEVMDVPGVLSGNKDLLEKILLFKDEILDGHCPGLRGYDLQAYLAAGIRSDHEVTDWREGYEKIQSGMMLMIREGTSAKNLEELVPLVNIQSARRCCLVSDDLSAEDIWERGHLDFIIKKAIGLGLDPAVAVQLVTLSPAEYFGLKDRGAIAPGFIADLVVLNDLESFHVSSVYKEGRMIVDNGVLINYPTERDRTKEIIESRPLKIAPIQPECFRIPYPGGKARVIELIPGQLITRLTYQNVKAVDGWVFSDTKTDILKLCVVERHHASGRIGLGLVKGFGLKLGAMASSVAHDSHNVIAVGVTDKEIFSAVEAARLMGGGIAVVRGSETIAEIPLPIAGLLSHEPFGTLLTKLRSVKKAVYDMGCKLEEPLMALSFLALPVIPELKLTDMGLVDVRHFEIVRLFLDT